MPMTKEGAKAYKPRRPEMTMTDVMTESDRKAVKAKKAEMKDEADREKAGKAYDEASKNMKKGGKVKAAPGGKKSGRAMQAVAARAVKSHEKRMHKSMASGGSVRGDGCAQRGKTKGAMR